MTEEEHEDSQIAAAIGDVVRIGRETGTITQIVDHGQVRVRLASGRGLKIDARLLEDVLPEPILEEVSPEPTGASEEE